MNGRTALPEFIHPGQIYFICGFVLQFRNRIFTALNVFYFLIGCRAFFLIENIIAVGVRHVFPGKPDFPVFSGCFYVIRRIRFFSGLRYGIDPRLGIWAGPCPVHRTYFYMINLVVHQLVIHEIFYLQFISGHTDILCFAVISDFHLISGDIHTGIPG